MSKRRPVISILVLVLLVLFQQFNCGDTDLRFDFSSSSQKLVADGLKDSFFASNILANGPNEVASGLKHFQRKLLRLRNSECWDEEEDWFEKFLVSRFEHFNSSHAWKNASESWRALDASLLAGSKNDDQVNDVVNQLSNMVTKRPLFYLSVVTLCIIFNLIGHL